MFSYFIVIFNICSKSIKPIVSFIAPILNCSLFSVNIDSIFSLVILHVNSSVSFWQLSNIA